MKPETGPSSPSQKPQWLACLLDTLAAFFVSLWSKLRTPIKQFVDAIHPQDSTKQAGNGGGIKPPADPPVVPAPSEEDDSRERRQENRDRWKLGMEIATLLAVIAYASVAYYQLQEMREATKASKISADAAKKAADTANATLKETIAGSHLDQRAWVGISQIGGAPEAKKPYDISVTIKNTGKTPGLNVRGYTGFSFLPTLTRKHFEEDCRNAKQVGGAVIPPNGNLSHKLHPSEGKTLPEDWEKKLAGRQFYVHGCVLYDDIFNEPHWLTFCTQWKSSSLAYSACREGKYNQTGDGPPPY